jgi:hypothetical protein
MYTVSLTYVLPGGKKVSWTGQVSSKNTSIIIKELKEKTGENIIRVQDLSW